MKKKLLLPTILFFVTGILTAETLPTRYYLYHHGELSADEAHNVTSYQLNVAEGVTLSLASHEAWYWGDWDQQMHRNEPLTAIRQRSTTSRGSAPATAIEAS